MEVVRGYFEVFNKWLASYWSDPERALEESPGLDAVFARLDPEAEWDWPLSPETFRGREQLLQAVADWLETVSHWRIDVEDLIEGSQGRVLLVGRVVARGKGSGAPIHQPIFTAVTVRNGKIALIDDQLRRPRPSKPPVCRTSRRSSDLAPGGGRMRWLAVGILLNDGEDATVVLASVIGPERLSVANARLLPGMRVHERVEATVQIDVVRDQQAARLQGAPGVVQLE